MSTMSSRNLVACAAALTLVAGCGDDQTDAPTGTLDMALSTTINSTTYLLTATFEVDGPEDHTLTPPPSDATYSIDLEPGDYTITLGDGWTLSASQNGGPYAPVDARLDGDETQAFAIFEGEVTRVRYTFVAGDGVIAFGSGRLTLEVGVVADVPGTGCEITSTCTTATVTCTGPDATIEDACRITNGPEGTTLTCDGDDATIPSGFGGNPHGYGIALRTLADFQGRLLAYFEAHGAYPVGTQFPTPMATCCAAGGVTQCPANPDAWIGIAIWEALDFVIEDAHAFVWSYSATSGNHAVVTGSGDLDCDGAPIAYTLTCDVTNGTPSCVVSLPLQCSPDDYAD